MEKNKILHPMFCAVKKLQYDFLVDGVVGNMMRQHYHDEYEIYLHLSGERNIFFKNKKYVLKRGSMFIIEPFVLHMTTNSDEAICSRAVMNFKKEAMMFFLTEKEYNAISRELNSCIIQLDEKQIEDVKSHFEEIKNQWRRYAVGKEKRCEKLAYMEIYRLIDRVLKIKSEQPEIINLESLEIVNDPEIFKVLRFIESNYQNDISLDDMVEYSHMSKSSFYRAFKKITGDTFANYLHNFRLSRAHRLVLETQLSFKEIAEKTGFSSTTSLTRAFNHQYGMAPSKIRKHENI